VLPRSSDDPTALEHPRGYDHVGATRDLRRLAQPLSLDFGPGCVRYDRVEDASSLGRVDIPGSATSTGGPLVIVVRSAG